MNDLPPDGAWAEGPLSEQPDAETLALLELSLVPGVGPRLAQRLLDAFGSAEAIWRQPSARIGELLRIGQELAGAMQATRAAGLGLQQWHECRQCHVRILARTAPEFPRLLKEIADPPVVLYAQGQYRSVNSLAVAIVGTRHASSYGLRQAAALATSLSRFGITVVSGLARGIDAAAHRAVLASGGRTVAVLAGGLSEVYPPEHRDLARQITAAGALLSEVDLHAKPRRGSFPRRNRLISGLSLGVVVVEATERSGALITARHAMEQGREVFALPGPVDVRTSRGCHQLLRDGAKLVETVHDVLEELGPFVAPLSTSTHGNVGHGAELQLNAMEQRVLQAIDGASTSIDQLVARCGLPVQRVLATISVLETRHLICRVRGDSVRRRFVL
jgi:DNA processing protein